MLSNVSPLSWVIFGLSVFGTVVLAWNVDPQTPAGRARIVGSTIAGIVALLTLCNGSLLGRRISSLEAGRYPRLGPEAWLRIAAALQNETPQTATIDAEGGDDIRDVVTEISKGLKSAHWHVAKLSLGGTLWDEGQGILVYHTEQATSAATALIGALQAEGLTVTDAGPCTTGNPVHIAFRRP
jgi:hypothetical protein